MDSISRSTLFSSENKKAFLTIAIIGIIVYLNSFFNGFVWDDFSYIINNPSVHSLNLIYAFGSNAVNALQFYRPLQVIYSALLYMLFQQNAFFYHVIQVLFHIANTYMIFVLFSLFFNRRISMLLALLFLIHPINVESVSYVSAASTVVSTFFGLLALLFTTKKTISGKSWIIISLLLLLSLLMKEEGVLYIFILFSLILFFRKKMLRVAVINEGLVLAIYFCLRFFEKYFATNKLLLENDISTLTAINTIPISNARLYERLITMPKIFFYYITTFFYPAKLAVDQLWIISSVTIKNFYLPLLIDSFFLLLLLFLTLKIFKSYKKLFLPYCFFFLWFLVGISLHIQLIPLDMTIADRWFYFPLIGLLGMIGLGIQIFIDNKRIVQAFTAILIIFIFLFSLRTIVRNTDYYNDGTLFNHDSEVQDNFVMETNLGAYYFKQGDFKQALVHQQKSISLYPYEINLSNLGATYRTMKELPLAKKYDLEAFNLHPNQRHISQVYIEFAWVLLISGDPNKALQIVNLGLYYYPNSTDLIKEEALINYKLGNQTTAIEAAKKLINLQPTEDSYTTYKKIISKEKIILSL